MGFPGGSDGKVSACNVGDPGSIPGLGRSPGEGNGNPLQYSCLENPTDGGAWWATVHGVAYSLLICQLSFEYIIRNKIIWKDNKIFAFDISYTYNLFTKGCICQEYSKTILSQHKTFKEFKIFLLLKTNPEEFLVVQWLELHTSIAGATSSSSGGTKIPQATHDGQKNQKHKQTKLTLKCWWLFFVWKEQERQG